MEELYEITMGGILTSIVIILGVATVLGVIGSLIIMGIIYAVDICRSAWDSRRFRRFRLDEGRFVRYESFQEIFGISGYTTKDNKPKSQGVIDKKLKELAIIFHKKDLRDRYLAKTLKLMNIETEKNSIRHEREKNRKELLEAKEDFWWAHHVAKYVGFRVRKRYVSYLSTL